MRVMTTDETVYNEGTDSVRVHPCFDLLHHRIRRVPGPALPVPCTMTMAAMSPRTLARSGTTSSPEMARGATRTGTSGSRAASTT